MRIRKNGKVINLTEGDLQRIVKRVLREQEEIIGGYTCKDSDGYVVCGKKDKYGYAIRVFKSPIKSDKLPNEAEFQAGGKTWEETVTTFNKKCKEKGLNLQPPTIDKLEKNN